MYLGERKRYDGIIESKTSYVLDCEESCAQQGSVLAGVFHLSNSNDRPDCHEEAKWITIMTVLTLGNLKTW